MGVWSLHGTFYVPAVGETNASKSVFDAALDQADELMQRAVSAIGGPNSVLQYYVQQMMVGRVEDSSGNKYFSTEKANGGDVII